jgi:hypothetical protein
MRTPARRQAKPRGTQKGNIMPIDPYQTNEGMDINDVPMRYINDGTPYGPLYFHQPQPTNGLAVAALVLGIVWAFWLGSALAIVFGHVALGQIRQRNQSGKGMAVAGLVLGYVGAGTFALFVVLPLLLGAGA